MVYRCTWLKQKKNYSDVSHFRIGSRYFCPELVDNIRRHYIFARSILSASHSTARTELSICRAADSLNRDLKISSSLGWQFPFRSNNMKTGWKSTFFLSFDVMLRTRCIEYLVLEIHIVQMYEMVVPSTMNVFSIKSYWITNWRKGRSYQGNKYNLQDILF